MGYFPTLAARETLLYGYGTSVTTVTNPHLGQPFQPIDTIVNDGAKDIAGESVSFASASLQGRNYANAINPRYNSILHLDMVMDMNISGNVGYNDYATYYALTTTNDYRQDISQFEITSTVFDGANKSLFAFTDGACFTMLDANENMGYLFHSAATNSNDMLVPYSRLYGWSGVRR